MILRITFCTLKYTKWTGINQKCSLSDGSLTVQHCAIKLFFLFLASRPISKNPLSLTTVCMFECSNIIGAITAHERDKSFALKFCYHKFLGQKTTYIIQHKSVMLPIAPTEWIRASLLISISLMAKSISMYTFIFLICFALRASSAVRHIKSIKIITLVCVHRASTRCPILVIYVVRTFSWPRGLNELFEGLWRQSVNKHHSERTNTNHFYYTRKTVVPFASVPLAQILEHFE